MLQAPPLGNASSRPRRRLRGARREIVERIRDEIEAGTYETERKLHLAVSRLTRMLHESARSEDETAA